MKKKWIHTAVIVLLVLEAVFLIARRIVPVELTDLMPEEFSPEQCRVNYFDWNDSIKLTGEDLQTLLGYLNGLEYRYDGRTLGGVMKGELYHLSLFQSEPPELVDLFVTKQRGIVYIDDREYEMLGDTEPLLEFLDGLQ